MEKEQYFVALSFLFEHGVGGGAKSSGEQVCAQVIMSLYNGDYPMPLVSLGCLAGEWREAANTVITGWKPSDDFLYSYLFKKYGEAAWDRFYDENQFRRKE